MRIEIIQNTINHIRCLNNSKDSLLASILLVLGILQSPLAYKKTKGHPISEIKEMIHSILLSFKPISKYFDTQDKITIADKLVVRRSINNFGMYEIILPDSLVIVEDKEEIEEYDYHVCISFAGEQRQFASKIANKLKVDYNLKVFYDDFENANLWGKDLFGYLYDIYSEKAHFCIVLISSAYLQKNWTNHELKAVQSRVLKERSEYFLPILLDSFETIPKEFKSIAYLNAKNIDIDTICDAVFEKVARIFDGKWLSTEELAEILSETGMFKCLFKNFYITATQDEDEEGSLRLLLLGIIYCFGGDLMRVDQSIKVIFDYLLFDFNPIANLFTSNNRFLAIPPNGYLIRSELIQQESLFMTREYWNPIVEEFKATNPFFYADFDE